MESRILEQQHTIRQVLSGDRKAEYLIPTWQDIDVLESVQAAVGPLADFTDVLSSEQLVTVSSKPVLCMLKRNVLAEAGSNTHLKADIKSCILHYIEGKYGDGKIEELLKVSSFCHEQLHHQ